MKSVSCLLATLVATCAPAYAQSGLTGTWRVEGIGDAFPWSLVLRVDESGVTGTVSSCASRRSVIAIYEGKVGKNAVTFKCRSLDDDRTMTLTGRLNGNELALTWEKQVREGGLRDGRDAALFGDSAPPRFAAARVREDDLLDTERQQVDAISGVELAAVNPVEQDGVQQVADTAFRPPIEEPAYPMGKGPVVLVDEAHRNFHTAEGRYLPFAQFLRRDGYVVEPSAVQFTANALATGRVLVIANAVAALTTEEVATVRVWVEGGGSLLLIADHPPFDTAAKDLGKVFGVHFSGGVAGDPNDSSGRLVFRRSDGTLTDHAITKGIDEVATFTGTSFQVDASGHPLLVFGPAVYVREGNDPNPRSVKGHLQGAVLQFGKGRVAVFSEAAMFSAQITGLDRHPMGMNAAIAKQNPQFLLNVMHWLTR